MGRGALLALAVACGTAPPADDAPDGEDDFAWDTPEPRSRVDVTLAVWNIEGVGAPGSVEFDRAVAVLERLDADVVGLNEVDEDRLSDLYALADEAGYATVVYGEDPPFGDQGNAILSRFAEVSATFPDGADLSGDASARDLTRNPVVFTTVLPGTDDELTVVVNHLKSGWTDVDGFRRTVDALRTAQAAEAGLSSRYLVVMGDMNADPFDPPLTPEAFTALPSGLPFSYDLGSDLLVDLSTGEGLAHDPLGAITALGLDRVEATRRDGLPGTRPSSERVLDHLFLGSGFDGVTVQSEVYVAELDDEAGLPTGPIPPEDATRFASDHSPVMMRFSVLVDEAPTP